MSRGILLYIDPGTGAALFTIILGVVSTLMFLLEKFKVKIKFILSGGKANKNNKNNLGIVMFSDGKQYWTIFKPICDEFEHREKECYFWTASPDDPALKEKYKYVKCEFIGEGNKAFTKLNTMTADICLATTPGLDVLQWKRSKNVKYYVHIQHSFGDLTGYRMFGTDYYDAILLTGEEQESCIRKLEKIRNLKEKEMITVGSTYMDTMLEKSKNLDTCDNKEITVLVAPSWGESSILNRFGDKFLQQLKQTGYNIIVRPHPQSKIVDKELLDSLQEKYPDTDNWQWNYDNDNFNVLSKADILISDFSCIIFDYTFIFNRPIIYTDTNFDDSPYDSCWLDEVPWKFEILTTIGKKLTEDNFSNMRDLIDSTVNNKMCIEGINKVKDSIWKYKEEAAKRTVEYLLDKQNALILGDK
jgi:CDP-glycerol glycerophosphotransferase (TagB/SpsB family)